MTTVVQIEGLSKHFVLRKEKSLKERVVNFGRSRKHREDFWALRDIDLQIESGTTLGLIGPNGSGKSTLLKMVGGILQPDSGSVKIRGRLAALLEARRRLPPRPHRPRERLPQRLDPGPLTGPDRPVLRRDRRLLRDRGLHRHPGEVLLLRDVRQARLRRRRARRP